MPTAWSTRIASKPDDQKSLVHLQKVSKLKLQTRAKMVQAVRRRELP